MEKYTEFKEREKKEIRIFGLASGAAGLVSGFASLFVKDEENAKLLAGAGAALAGVGLAAELGAEKVANIDAGIALRNGYVQPDPPSAGPSSIPSKV